jgi:hypothetical protein
MLAESQCGVFVVRVEELISTTKYYAVRAAKKKE